LTDLAAYEGWNPYLVRVEGEPRAGSQIAVHARPAPDGDVVVQMVDVISAEPYAMRWEGGLPDRTVFKGDHWWVLEPLDAGTRLRHFEHFSGSAAAKLLAAHRASIAANFERFNAALKRVAEAR
jgi:hypothetical protein